MLRRFFLPESPDVLGMLHDQAKLTADGVELFHTWAKGDPTAANAVRECEKRADALKRELRRGLTEAFSTPLEPEDIFELSVGLDDILNAAKNAVREAEVLGSTPDRSLSDMAGAIAVGTKKLAGAIEALGAKRTTEAIAIADEAVAAQRDLEHIYRRAMGSLVGESNPAKLAERRELYRRAARMGDNVVRVAERVWYAVLKTT